MISKYSDGMTKAANANVYFNPRRRLTTSSNAKKGLGECLKQRHNLDQIYYSFVNILSVSFNLGGTRISVVMNAIDHTQFVHRKR